MFVYIGHVDDQLNQSAVSCTNCPLGGTLRAQIQSENHDRDPSRHLALVSLVVPRSTKRGLAFRCG